MKKILLTLALLATILSAKGHEYSEVEKQYLEALTKYNYEKLEEV